MIELVADTWIAVPILEGMGYWAVNTKQVGSSKPSLVVMNLATSLSAYPRPEQKPWR